MEILPAVVEDAAEILALQKLAYASEAALYGDETLPPLTQTLEQMQADFERQVVLKAVVDDAIAGSVRAHQREGTCYIGRLIVHPSAQGRGLGTRLMTDLGVTTPIQTCLLLPSRSQSPSADTRH